MHPVRTASSWLVRRTGRRGAVLLVLGVVDLAYGLAIVSTLTRWHRTALVWWPVSQAEVLYIPTRAWGVIWIFVGSFLLAGALARVDSLFFAVEVLLKTAWGLAALLYFLDGGLGLWAVGIVHIGMAVLAVIAAGWRDQPVILRLETAIHQQTDAIRDQTEVARDQRDEVAHQRDVTADRREVVADRRQAEADRRDDD